MENNELRKVYKLNTLEIAKHHREFCEGEDCNISLIILMQMAENLGVSFTEKEKELFI